MQMAGQFAIGMQPAAAAAGVDTRSVHSAQNRIGGQEVADEAEQVGDLVGALENTGFVEQAFETTSIRFPSQSLQFPSGAGAFIHRQNTWKNGVSMVVHSIDVGLELCCCHSAIPQ